MLSMLEVLASPKPSYLGGHLITRLLMPLLCSPCRFPVSGAMPDFAPLSRCQARIFSIPCVNDRPPNLPSLFDIHLQETLS